MIKAVLIVLLISPAGDGYRDFVAFHPNMAACQKDLARARKALPEIPGFASVSCAPVTSLGPKV